MQVQETAKPTEPAIVLENSHLSLTIRPDLGGRIDQITDLHQGRDWLWHPSYYRASETRSLPIGTCFDDVWTGGWDEIFPNDMAENFQGRSLVDHGELWSQPWQVVEQSEVQIKLSYQCQTVPVSVEKIIQLDATQLVAHLDYRLQNHSDETIPFLFKHHAAIAIEAGDEILLPECLVEPVTLDFSKMIGQARRTTFPQAFDGEGQEIDLRWIPSADSQLQEFYYCLNLSQGHCGLRHQRTQTSLMMRFDTSDFPYIWLFQSYGGWRDHYVIVMEPATTIPFDLATACKNGTAAQLAPHAVQQRRLTISLQA